MKVKFLLNQTMRIRGVSQVFTPGETYDLDAATVGSLGLLRKVDGFGFRCFEAVAEPAAVSGPVLTPEDVHVEAREKRVADMAAAKAAAVENKKAAAAAA
ncbi:MAG: hypothetical protein Q7U75_19405, partial [Desulfobacterales bacterium]|nr:hypothetical protein [Desulfobacterales bacterium]